MRYFEVLICSDVIITFLKRILSIKIRMMKRLLPLLLICLLAVSTAVQAQHKRHHGGKMNLERLKSELELSDEQISKMEAMSEELRSEMMEVKNQDIPHEEKREQLKAIGEKKKSIMDEILTEEQQEKLKTIQADRDQMREKKRAERMEKMKEKHEAMKPMMEEMKAYHNNNIAPVISEKRAKLDKEMKRKDRKKVEELRVVAQNVMEEMKSHHEEMMKKMENGERSERGHGKPPHHGKHHKKGMMGKMGGKEMMAVMKLWKDHQEDFESALEMTEKYADDIDQVMAEMEGDHKKWKEGLKQIKQKYMPEKLRSSKGSCKGKKEGKSSCTKGAPEKSSCTKGADKSCCKGASEKSCCPKGGSTCEKGDKKDWGEMKSKFQSFKRVAFLLMPTEMLEEEVKREVQPLMVLESKVYPNPSSDSNTIEFRVVESGKYRVELYSKEGKQIKVVANEKMEAGVQSLQVDLSSLPAGSYYYLITDGKSTQNTEQFIKR